MGSGQSCNAAHTGELGDGSFALIVENDVEVRLRPITQEAADSDLSDVRPLQQLQRFRLAEALQLAATI